MTRTLSNPWLAVSIKLDNKDLKTVAQSRSSGARVACFMCDIGESVELCHCDFGELIVRKVRRSLPR